MTENLVFGIRPVVEAIEAGKQIEKLYIRKGAEGQLMTELRDLCLRHRIRTQEVPVEKLNRLTRGNHQGVVAQISPIGYVELNDILERVPEDETPLIVLFDGVTDVRNFGAIARSAECAGAHGLIVPLKNAAPVNSEAIRSSAGSTAVRNRTSANRLILPSNLSTRCPCCATYSTCSAPSRIIRQPGIQNRSPRPENPPAGKRRSSIR